MPSAPPGIRSSLVISLRPSAKRLQPAELAADARRTEAILNAAGDLALEPDEDQRADRDQT